MRAFIATAIFSVHLLTPARAECLELADAAAIAADRSPLVRLAEADKSIAAADLRAARSLSRPSVAAFGRTAGGDNGLTNNIFENQVGLRASQRILDFGDARLARRSARAGIAARDFQVEDASEEAALEVGFVAIAREEFLAKTKLLADRVSFLTHLEEQLRAAINQGTITQSEYLDVAVQLQLAQSRKIEMDFLLSENAEQLRTLIGVENCISQKSVEALSSPQLALMRVDHRRQNTDLPAHIESLRASVQQEEFATDRVKRSRLPVVELVGVASYAQGVTDTWEYQQRLGVDVSVPLYTGSLLGSQTDRSNAQLGRLKAELAQAEREWREQRAVSRQRLLALAAQLTRQSAAVSSKREQFEFAEQEFNAGFLILPEFVKDQIELQDAELKRIQVKYDLAREVLIFHRIHNGLIDGIKKSNE